MVEDETASVSCPLAVFDISISVHRNTGTAISLVTNFPTEYLLTPWSRVLLEKLTGLQLVKKFPAFYGTRRFFTALTSACHLLLS
jgi:hypothetical protein